MRFLFFRFAIWLHDTSDNMKLSHFLRCRTIQHTAARAVCPLDYALLIHEHRKQTARNIGTLGCCICVACYHYSSKGLLAICHPVVQWALQLSVRHLIKYEQTLILLVTNSVRKPALLLSSIVSLVRETTQLRSFQ